MHDTIPTSYCPFGLCLRGGQQGSTRTTSCIWKWKSGSPNTVGGSLGTTQIGSLGTIGSLGPIRITWHHGNWMGSLGTMAVMFTTHRMQKNRAFASMRYMLGNFNACVRPVWDGPIVFQRLQHFTTSKSSTGILWYVTFDIPQCLKGFVGNCESHKVTCL